MVKLSYMVPLTDYAIPMKKGLTKEILNSLYKNSNLRTWLKQHSALIKSIPNKPQIISDFCDAGLISEYYRRQIDEEMAHLLPSLDARQSLIPVEVMSGGNDTLPLTDDDLVGTIAYLHSVSMEDIDQPFVEQKVGTHQNIIIKTPLFIDDIMELSPPKRERLVYLIGHKDKQFVIKIAIALEKFVNELLIYEDLNGYANSKKNIIQTYYLKIFDINDPHTIIFNVVNKEYVFDITLFPNIQSRVKKMFGVYNFGRKNRITKCCVMILEYKKQYLTMYDYLEAFKSVSCDIVSKTIDILHDLNLHRGFVHMDLHYHNLLIDVNNKAPILYDFDMSFTSKRNNEIYTKALMYYCNNTEKDNLCLNNITTFNSNKTEYGFIFDLLKILVSSRVDLNCYLIDKKYLDIIKMYQNQEYKDVPEFEKATIKIAVILGPDFIKSMQSGGSFYHKYQKYKHKYQELARLLKK